MRGKVSKTTGEEVTKAAEIKAEVEDKAESVQTAEEQEDTKAGKKPGRRTRKTAEKTATKKTTAAKAGDTKATRTAAKKEVKTSVTVQFEGKSYSQEELMRIAKDVWKFDLKKKVGDLKSVELYVKPEENTCYYVMNNEIAGSFSL